MPLKFKLIIPVFNAEQWISKCLKSIMDQKLTYHDWEAIVIDDNSSDKTLDKIKETLANSKDKTKFKVLHRTFNVGALENIVFGISKICNDPEDIIILIDGDDWLASDDVLETLREVYHNKDIWLTYGQYVNASNNTKGCSFIITDTVNYRKQPSWGTSHLRTFKYKLWKLIDDRDLRDSNNRYFSMTWDQAIMFPLIEMCGKDRIKYIDKTLYVYNDNNPINDFRKNAVYQLELSSYIKRKQPYVQVKDLDKLDVNLIIFSKDRPAQLDLLLRSIKRFFIDYNKYDFNILYKSSTEEFERGYTLLKTKHPEFRYIQQTDFKVDVVNLVNSENTYTMLGVDDNIFIDFFDFNSREAFDFKNNINVLSLSLRLGNRINYCYSMNCSSPVPHFGDKRQWEWADHIAEWNYPCSIDFSLFRTCDIIGRIQDCSYANPNYLEGMLDATKNTAKRLMMCYQNPKIVGIPNNRVQTSHLNRCKNSNSVEELNRRFLEGYYLDIDLPISNHNAPHMEIEYVLKR